MRRVKDSNISSKAGEKFEKLFFAKAAERANYFLNFAERNFSR